MKYLASLSLFLCLLPVPQLSAQVGNEAKKPDAVKAPQAEVKKGETGAGGKGEGEESDPAFKLVPAPDGRAYFPKGRAGWYTRHLSVMKEPSLQPKEKEPGEWTLRFTWLRSFHKPIAVRVWKEGNDVRMRAVRLNGKGGYDPGKIDKDIARKLTTDEWKALQPLTETKELWMPLTGEEEATELHSQSGPHFMKTTFFPVLLLSLMTVQSFCADTPITLVIHGGAGIMRKELTPAKEAEARKGLEQALRAGFKVLQNGGSSTDAVTTAIVTMEDLPVFNAGRGAVLTSAGTVELDASIMEGAKRRAGAAASIQGVKNPILLARRIMEDGRHVMMTGRGAETFAREAKLTFEPAEYFIIPERVEELKKHKEKEQQRAKEAKKKSGAFVAPPTAGELIGTVGAVALDKDGHLAAGTSTGGRTGKLPGRIGDSPVIGAGTWAEDGVVAVSCTGHGEYFIRLAIAHDLAARIKYQNLPVATAATALMKDDLTKAGGTGGLIALDSKGNISTPFNTEGMFRASMRADGTVQISIFEDP
ncbi:MAG TPA: isoaspartyl peptidase/L-asparaginase [Verrucomicrobiales bacterium]|nr:isoaspartyl peptidase/L-asparaginase [Verrucomicrobiales bacterium]